MSESGSMIGDAVERLLADARPGAAFDTPLWGRLAAAGVPRLLRPESQGGAGDAIRDAVAVLRAVGRHAPAVPLADALVAHWLLSRTDIDPGERPVLLEVAGADGVPDSAEPLAFARASDVDRLYLKPWGAGATACWMPADGASSVVPVAHADTLRHLLVVASSAVLVGAMRQALGLALDWANVRVQFGRPIGRFQAVQHPLVVAAEEVAAAGAALDWAAARLEAGQGWPAAWVAKARAAEVAGRVAAVTHQVHGAIGFTAEHPLHHATRLLWRWRDRWGDETQCHAVLGRAALAAGPDALFDLVIGDPPAVPGEGSAR